MGVIIVSPEPTPTSTPLDTPTLTVTPNSDGTANLCTWSTVAGVYQWRLQKSLDDETNYGATTARDWELAPGTLSYNDQYLDPGRDRYYRLRAESDPADSTKANSAYDVEGPIRTDAPAPGGSTIRPAHSSSCLHIPGKPDALAYQATGGEGTGGYDFWITSLADTSTATSNFRGWGANHYSGTWRGARDLSFSVPSGANFRVHALISGKCQTTGFMTWTKSNTTIDFSSAPSPGFFWGAGYQQGFDCVNFIYAHTDTSMDNNVSVASMENRDAWYVGNCGPGVIYCNSARWSCDEVVDCVDKVGTGWVAFSNNFWSNPLSKAGRTGDDAIHGYFFIIGYNAKNIVLDENVFAHGNGRAIHCRSTGVVGNNNVIYNVGYQSSDSPKWAGFTELAGDFGGTDAPLVNWRGNFYITGSNPFTPYKPLQLISNTGGVPTVSASARWCLKDNYYRDASGVWTWDQTVPANFNMTVGDALAGGILTTTVNSSIEPSGYTVWTITMSGGQPDATEMDAAVEYIVAHAGKCPGDRAAGPDSIVAAQVVNGLLNNGGDRGSIINDESEMGGHFTVVSNSITDPSDSAQTGGNPFPIANPEAAIVGSDGRTRLARNVWRLKNNELRGCVPWGQAA